MALCYGFVNVRPGLRTRCGALLCSASLLACSAQSGDPGATGGSATGGAPTSGGSSGDAGATAGSSVVAGASSAMAGSAGAGLDAGGASGSSASSGAGGSVQVAGNGGVSAAGAAGSGAASGGAASGGAANYDPCPPRGTACRLMPMGDSITEGFRSTGYGGYRAPLFHLALSHQRSITFVGSAPLHGPATVDGVAFPQANEGIGGRRIADLVAIIPTTITANKPHILLLEIGTNNIYEGASSMSSELAGLLDKILAADPKLLLVVATIIPTKTDSTTATVQAYDKTIPALVKARADTGKHIVLVDMFSAFTKNASYQTAYMKDDLHPNDTGYSLMADVWYAGLQSFLR